MTIRCGPVFAVFLFSAPMSAYAQALPTAPKMPSDSKAVPASSTTSDPSATPKAVGQGGTSATVLDVSAIQGLMGRSVKSYVGDDMGQVVDCLVTPAGQPRAVVIDFGGVLGVGSRKVAVDWKALDFSGLAKGRPIVLALTRNEVRVSPEYKAGDPVVVLEATKPEGQKTAASVQAAPALPASSVQAPMPPTSPVQAPAPPASAAAHPDPKKN